MFKSFRTAFLLLALAVAALGGCSKEARKSRLVERAQKDFAAEEYEKAEIGYLNALRIAPGDPVSIRQLGIIYYTEGRLIEAYRYLQRAAEAEPENIDVQLKLGLTYLSFRKLKEAREQAENVLAKRPGDEEALVLLAETAVSDKEILEIQKRIGQLRGQDQERAGYYLASGALSLRQKDLPGAERAFQKALALEPTSETVHLALGNLHWARNEISLAEKAFQTAAQNAPWRSPRRLKLAEFHLKNGKTAVAKTHLQEITEKAPDYFPAWSLLIQVSFAERNAEECAALIAKVLLRDPTNFDALLYSGRLKMTQGDVAGAIADFERMIRYYGQISEINFQLGRAYFQNGDVTKATRSLNAALSSNPNFAPAIILLLTEIQIRQGNVVAAIPRLVQLVKAQPQIMQAHLLLASAYLWQKKNDEAMAIYRQMLVTFPKEPHPPLLLGVTLKMSGKNNEARKAFQKSLEIAPDSLPALEQLVELDVAEKAYAAAQERLQKEIQKKPDTAELWLFLAKVQMAQKNNEAAESSLQKSVSLNPELQISYTLLARLYVDSNRRQEALQKLTEVSGKTNDIAVLMQIGMIYDQLKNFTAARDAYEKILETKPRFSPALNNLAYLYSEHLGELDKAHTMAEKARQLLPYEPTTADTLGWILFKKGNYSRALGLIQESASKLPNHGEIQFHLGMTHYMLGDEESARVALEKALQSEGAFPGKNEIPSRLAVLQIDIARSRADDQKLLEKRFDDQPQDSIAASRLAALYERQGDISDAVKILDKALKANPANAKIMMRLSGLYARHLKDPKKALEMAKDAYNAEPENPHISQALGRLAYEARDYQWALSLLQDASRNLPASPELNFDLARCYYQVGQVAAAESLFKNAVQTGASFEGSEEAKRTLAMIDLSRNPEKIPAAISNVREILKTQPDYVPALKIAALAFEKEGNPQEAKKQYEKILAANPLFTPAYRDLANLNDKYQLEDPKNYEVAVRARTAFPDDPEVARSLGKIFFQRKDYTRAAQLLEESSRKLSRDAELFYYLGMAQHNLKRRNESRASLNQALALNLSASLAEDAKRVLAEIR